MWPALRKTATYAQKSLFTFLAIIMCNNVKNSRAKFHDDLLRCQVIPEYVHNTLVNKVLYARKFPWYVNFMDFMVTFATIRDFQQYITCATFPQWTCDPQKYNHKYPVCFLFSENFIPRIFLRIWY